MVTRRDSISRECGRGGRPAPRGFTLAELLIAIGLISFPHVLFGAARCLAQDAAPQSDSEKLASWFAKEWEAAQRLPALPAGLSWRKEDHELVSPSELAALRDSVRAHPEHPDRDRLDRLDAHSRGEWTTARFDLFIDGTRWRFNRHLNGHVWMDSAFAPGVTWALGGSDDSGPAGLTRRLALPSAPGVALLDHDEKEFLAPIGQMLNGGFGYARLSGLTADVPRWLGENRWTVSARRELASDSFAENIYTGRWDQGLERGFVEALVLGTRAGESVSVIEVKRFYDWKLDETLGIWVAGRIDSCDPSGRLLNRVLFSGAVAPPATMAELVREPRRGVRDAVRGEVPLNATFVDEPTGLAEVTDPVTGETKAIQLARPGVKPEGSTTKSLIGVAIAFAICGGALWAWRLRHGR